MSAKDDDTTIKHLSWLVCQIAIQRDEALAAIKTLQAEISFLQSLNPYRKRRHWWTKPYTFMMPHTFDWVDVAPPIPCDPQPEGTPPTDFDG